MNVTVLTTRLFGVPASGGELCTARLLTALRQAGHRVRLIGRGDGGLPGAGAVVAGAVADVDADADAAADAAAAVSLGPLVPAFDSLRARQRSASLLGALASGQACTVHRLAAGAARRRLRQALLAPGVPAPDAVVVDHLQAWHWIAPLLATDPGSPCAAAPSRLPAPLLVMHNLEPDGYAALAVAASGLRRQVLQREARLLAQLEAQALQGSAAVACLSQADADVLCRRAGLGGPSVVVLPGYAMPPAGVPTAGGSSLPWRAGRCIGLLGTWTWAPNRAALQWMLEQVLPCLPPHCHLLLAGTGLDGMATASDRVSVLGRISDPQAFYRAVQVVAVPSLGGSGVQEKAIEAIASAGAVVATPFALRGLGPGLPAHVHAAEAPADFAALCAGISIGQADARATTTWALQRQAHYHQVLDHGLRASAASRR